MIMYLFGSLTSQALEVMTALIQGNFVQWMDTRGNYVGGGFNLYFCGEGGADDDHVEISKSLLIPHLQQFSDSLKGYRIGSADPQFEDSMADNTRFVMFKLVQPDKPDVSVKITFRRVEPYPGDSTLWGKWRLDSHGQTVVCKAHPDNRFDGKLVLKVMPEYSDFGLEDPSDD